MKLATYEETNFVISTLRERLQCVVPHCIMLFNNVSQVSFLAMENILCVPDSVRGSHNQRDNLQRWVSIKELVDAKWRGNLWESRSR
jgi:hypothetical protein